MVEIYWNPIKINQISNMREMDATVILFTYSSLANRQFKVLVIYF
jgi:hypothetical protein